MGKKLFKGTTALNKEIRKRDYNNIVGLKAIITEKEYDYFLNVLPPIYSPKGGFLLMETLTHNDKGAVNLWFYKRKGKFYAEVSQRADHVSQKELIRAGMI